MAAALVASLIALAGCGGGATSTATPTATALKEIGRFDAPLYVTQPPGSGDLYVVERGGVVKIVRGGRTLPTPSLTSPTTSRPRASRGCSRSPSPPTTRAPACSTPTTPTHEATSGSSS